MRADSCICQGYGWYRACDCPYQDIQHCPDFGKAFPCVCTLQSLFGSRRLLLHEQCGLADEQRLNLTMDRFDPRRSEDATAMRDLAVRFITGKGRQWLVLAGTPGAGKTHICGAIVNAMVAQMVEAQYITASDLIIIMRDAENGIVPDDDPFVPYSKLLARYARLPVLVIDDLKTDLMTTPASFRYIEAVLDKRYTEAAATVITTNVDPNKVPDRWDSRMRDEMMSAFLVVTPPDVRLEDAS